MAWLWSKKAADNSNIWIIGFRGADGRVKNKSLGKGLTRRDAKRLLAEFERTTAMIKAGLKHEIQNDYRMLEFMDRHEAYSRSQKAPRTADRDDEALRRFKEFVGNIPLSSINKDLIEKYMTYRRESVSPSTINVEIRHLKAAFSQAVRWDLIHTNHFKGIKMLKVPAKDIPKFLEKKQINSFMEAMQNDPLLPLARFYLLTGARLSEGIHLKGEDIDFEHGLIHFRGKWTKNKQNRSIPFNQLPELRELFLQQNPQVGQPVFHSSVDHKETWCVDWVSRHISGIFNKIDMPWATCHTLRHTFASHLVMAGVELFTVSRLLGHSSIAVTEKHYAHLAPKHAEEALGKLPF